METPEKLISRLVADLKPVRPVGPSWRPALAGWLIGALGVSLLLTAWLHLRADLPQRLGQAFFVFRGTMLLLSSLLASLAVLKLSVPGRGSPGRESRLALVVPAGLTLVLGLLTLLAVFRAPETVRCGLSEAACTSAVLALSVMPGALLFALLRRYAPTRPGLTGALAGVAASLLGSAALGLHCPNDTPLHQLLWHLLLPVGLAAGAGWAVGRRWLRW
jgi:hypothetical protein